MIRRAGGGGRCIVERGEVPHTSALLDDRTIGEPNAEKLHADAGRTGTGVVPIIATVRAPPSHGDSQRVST